MEQTLIIFKPSAIERALVGKILSRFEQKGLTITGMKMMKLSEELLRQHYAHLTDRPFFPLILSSMTASPVIVMVLEGIQAISVVRTLTGATNGREALPGTIRGDYSMSNQENIIHASSSPEDAKAEIARFFTPDEIFPRTAAATPFINSSDELKSSTR
ncbi:MAG: nucleoside-diphosphate kinase [Duncaniella sp.]|uniref:nucleoside-diphosphate kinase n=1 Tax=Duncaniella sp. TaxID=2518496 RepID=UPI0023CB9FB9|nr:nucleoside-diphosphate kinase [Duncaniella sp.]MDE5988707.1 nucleoside-diphosphate kinase [Duncaniella sp.]